MKYLIIIINLIAFTILAAPTENKERLDTILSKGFNLFENNICVSEKGEEGAIRYFEDYINLGGNRDDVLKYLAFCKISVGQSKEEETDSLKEGVKFLSEVFEKDNQNIDLLKLLLSLYIQLENYEKAKTYAILINEENNIDNDIFLLIARLHFNTKEYHKVINYALKYKITDQNKELEEQKLFIIAYSYFKLKDNKKAKIYFNKLLENKNISKEFKETSIEVLKQINENENFGKYPKWYNINLINGLVFDSNVTSQPPFLTVYKTDTPGLPSMEGITEEKISAMGARDENYISLFLYPLNLNKHAIILNLNNFMAFHYPMIIKELFDPQDYDVINASGILGYEYHNYFSKKNVLKLFLYGGYSVNWMNPINNPNLYSKSILSGFNIFYKFKNNIDIALYSSFNYLTFNIKNNSPDIYSQDGKYFSSILSTSLPITNNFTISLSSGYIGSDTIGSLFSYNGFSGSGKLTFEFFNFLSLSSSISFEKKGYKDNLRDDQLITFNENINFEINNYFNLDLAYTYNKNESSIDGFTYEKHLLGLYLNFNM